MDQINHQIFSPSCYQECCLSVIGARLWSQSCRMTVHLQHNKYCLGMYSDDTDYHREKYRSPTSSANSRGWWKVDRDQTMRVERDLWICFYFSGIFTRILKGGIFPVDIKWRITRLFSTSWFTKTTSLCININIDGASIASHTHTYPPHSQVSLILFASLSFGTPFPRQNYCVNGLDVLDLSVTTPTSVQFNIHFVCS
jgi:hypothetical protein